MSAAPAAAVAFPFLFGGTFIEAGGALRVEPLHQKGISLPFRRDFH